VADQHQLLDQGFEAANAAGGNNLFEPWAMVRNEILDGRQEVYSPAERQRSQVIRQRRGHFAKRRRGWLELAIYAAVLERRSKVRQGDDSKLACERERLLFVDGLELEETTDQAWKPGAAGAWNN
jgi:hypothetical protein